MSSTLRQLREERGWTHERAAAEMGISRSQLIKLERGERRLTVRTIQLAAKAFGVGQARIMADLLPKAGQPREGEDIEPEAPTDLKLVTSPMVRANYAGRVQAGVWREIDELDEGDARRESVVVERDREFPDAKTYVFAAVGNSMNELKPRPILEGDRVVCLDYESLAGRMALRDGMVVVIERRRNGGHQIERSIKQLELYEDRYEFHPRSTDKRHKPIVIPHRLLRDLSEDDGTEVRILAVARKVVNDLVF